MTRPPKRNVLTPTFLWPMQPQRRGNGCGKQLASLSAPAASRCLEGRPINVAMSSFGSWLASCIVFLFVCLASSRIAVFFPLVGLPLITGHLFVGALAGPFVLGVVQAPDIVSLGFVTQFALSYIAFSAGSELYAAPFPHRFDLTSCVGICPSSVPSSAASHIRPLPSPSSALPFAVLCCT